MKRYTLIIALLLCSLFTVSAQRKQSVSVLYVGGTSDYDTYSGIPIDSVVMAKSTKDRMASFESFLKKHFKTVKVVHAKEYNSQMSDLYDVTIMDAHPEPIVPRIIEKDENGRTIRYESAQYLPFDFDRPLITIAQMGENIGNRLGSKNDWYCLCLYQHALGWNENHPIFKGPMPVKLNTVMRPTPSSALEYAKFDEITLPDSTLMFRVHTMESSEEHPYRIGMVSRPGGYLDSPETEIISGGECAKSIDAVAIGRHANHLSWGFSASPANMTNEAKALFVNSIVYMAQFAGQHPIARKMQQTVSVRSSIQTYSLTREAWEDYKAMIEVSNNFTDSIQKVAKAKQERGEELTSMEQMYSQFPIEEVPPFSQYIKRRAGKLYHYFGEDVEEYKRYYKKNYDYFYCEPGSYDLDIDEDARYLKIPNNDKRILDKAISMLENNEEPEIAQRVLKRYTLCRFETPKEWREWYETYKDRLFFTESGGWLFLVNTFEDVPGNDYRVFLREQEAKFEAMRKNRKGASNAELTNDMNPVFLSAELKYTVDGTMEIVIKQVIHKGYHTYADVSEGDPFIETEVKFELPEGIEKVGDIIPPASHKMQGSQTTVYEGEGEFRQLISKNPAGKEIKVFVTYQCCNDNGCLVPVTKELTVKM